MHEFIRSYVRLCFHVTPHYPTNTPDCGVTLSLSAANTPLYTPLDRHRWQVSGALSGVRYVIVVTQSLPGPVVAGLPGPSPAPSLTAAVPQQLRLSHMSTTTYQPTTDTCAYRDCTREFPVGDATDGSYCSKHCSWRDTGEGLLRDLRHNHTICGSCFRLRKDIERPPETYLRRHFTRDGHGYTRDEETGEWGLVYYDQSVSRSAVIGFEEHRHARMGPEGLECRCGGVDHDVESQPLRNTAAWEWWLQLASEHLRDIGQRDDALTAADVAEAYHQKGDLGLAVGVALEARANREAIARKRDRFDFDLDVDV